MSALLFSLSKAHESELSFQGDMLIQLQKEKGGAPIDCLNDFKTYHIK